MQYAIAPLRRGGYDFWHVKVILAPWIPCSTKTWLTTALRRSIHRPDNSPFSFVFLFFNLFQALPKTIRIRSDWETRFFRRSLILPPFQSKAHGFKNRTQEEIEWREISLTTERAG
jgi:hypothetical protein